MSKMLWGGRFSSGPADALLEFTSGEGVLLDARLIPYDIWGNRAHTLMLARQKIISKGEAANILAALSSVEQKAEAGTFKLRISLEDVHMNVETEVTAITQDGKKMHTARSRNDQVNTDTRLCMRDIALELSDGIIELQDALFAISEKQTPFIAYTHTQVAQPVSVSFWAKAHYDALSRDLARLRSCYSRINSNPLGAGAVAGTTWPIDRKYTAALMGFESVQENPMDCSSSRGEAEAELIYACLQTMLHLSRISEDLIFLSAQGMAELSDSYSTGSSMMPQKKNPDPLELVRARSARVLGNATHAFALQKGMPSGYNLDSQESKFAMMGAADTTLSSLSILKEIVLTLKFNSKKILAELERGFACATEAADVIARSGVPFRKAHEISGTIVRKCIAEGRKLSDFPSSEASALAGVKIPAKDWADAVNPDKSRRHAFMITPSDNADAKKEWAELRASVEAARKKTLLECGAMIKAGKK